MFASHVVVDTIDGYTFRAGSDGVLFTEATATAFAAERNAEMKPQYRSYQVFALVPAAGTALAAQVAAGQPVTAAAGSTP